MRQEIIKNVCYTELVYGRINKKLKINLSKSEIEEVVTSILIDEESTIEKKGKNYYITSMDRNIVLTINSYTYRVVTASRIQ